jgi:hypothetical protein
MIQIMDMTNKKLFPCLFIQLLSSTIQRIQEHSPVNSVGYYDSAQSPSLEETALLLTKTE